MLGMVVLSLGDLEVGITPTTSSIHQGTIWRHNTSQNRKNFGNSPDFVLILDRIAEHFQTKTQTTTLEQLYSILVLGFSTGYSSFHIYVTFFVLDQTTS